MELFSLPELSTLHFELQARKLGYRSIAGIDEVGRGPLAGPVVAAAVILPLEVELPGLTDSKKLSPKKREDLLPLLRERSLSYAVGVATPAEIDRLNILSATLLAMQRAIGYLRLSPDYLLVDGTTPVPGALPQKTLKQGDSRSLSIAAASVLAKVVRDRMMLGYDRLYPGFGFAAHKGYGSRAHCEAIERLGPCPIHRTSFGRVREFC